MTRPALLRTCVSMVCLLAIPALAEAQPRHRHAVAQRMTAPPLTVTKRSWLDSGNVVAVGSQNSYLSASTTLNQPIYSSYSPARFGQSALPGQFELAFSNGNPRGPESGGIFFDDVQ